MLNITELEALQNAANCLKLGITIRQYIFNDKRKTTPHFFAQLGQSTISPTLPYNELNHFLSGMIRAKELLTNQQTT
jgi:hypothetical protein